MHNKNQRQTSSNQSRTRGHIVHTNRNVRATYNTTPNLPSFSSNNATCPHGKSIINILNKPSSRRAVSADPSSHFKRQDDDQVIYQKYGHRRIVKNDVGHWLNDNSRIFSAGMSNNNVPLQKIPITNIYTKCVRSNINNDNKSSQRFMVQQKVSQTPKKITTNSNIPEPPKIQQNTNNVRQNSPSQKGRNVAQPPNVQKSNENKKQVNKNKNNNSKNTAVKPTTSQPPKGNITELYRRNETSDSKSVEDITFQRVTQNLANIIRNFQKQIQDVPVAKMPEEQIPSAMLRPKIKEFFKNPPKQQNKPAANVVNNTNENQSGNKQNTDDNNNEKQIEKPIVSKQSSTKSIKSYSAGSNRSFSSHNVRQFSSFTHHNLSVSSTSSSRRVNRTSSFSADPLKQMKEEVQKAIRERKTFTVRGHFGAIRKALLSRGWVEKFHSSYKDTLRDDLKRYQNYTISELMVAMRKEDVSTLCKNLIKSKLLGAYQVDFYWGSNDQAFRENPDKVKLTIINKLKRDIFSYTNKQGLCDASKMSHWYQKSNVYKLNHPRSYSLGKNGDLKGFTDDFNITAAMSLLKWVVKINSTKECKVMSPSGKIPLEAFDFALNECCKFIKKERHEDIDMKIPEAKEHEWNKFLDYFYKLVHYNNHFKAEATELEESLVRKSNYILNNMRSFYPYVDMDGMMNIWILKPVASSRGRGIHMCRTLQYVLKVIRQNQNIRYIVQKYIERPLLIRNTKFDIRQWFLISNCSPLTIWMYKQCYLRFSSQTYNLRKLHESIHLTNNSVQCKYKNNSVDTALPSYNMWDSLEFQTYLTNIGYPNAFKEVIYSGMRQSITAAVLMHHDKMVIRKNCFELYGADFILTEDFRPWLLEINSNPALFSSTPITARMCPKVLEDVIKVVIDFAHNSKADTGGFEMVYKEQLQKLPLAASLELKGQPLQRDYFCNERQMSSASDLPISASSPSVTEQAHDYLKTFGEDIKKTLRNLLQIIQSEKQRRGLLNQKNENTTSVVPAK